MIWVQVAWEPPTDKLGTLETKIFWQDDEDGGGWSVVVNKVNAVYRGCGNTKEECEAKARQYLNTLKDKGETR